MTFPGKLGDRIGVLEIDHKIYSKEGKLTNDSHATFIFFSECNRIMLVNDRKVFHILHLIECC